MAIKNSKNKIEALEKELDQLYEKNVILERELDSLRDQFDEVNKLIQEGNRNQSLILDTLMKLKAR